MRKFHVIEAFRNEQPVLPMRQTLGSGGYDLASLYEVTIKPNEIVMIQTGLKVEMPKNEVMLVFPRSSLGLKKRLMMANNVGVIDSDYFNTPSNEGHIMIPLYNFGQETVTINKGERVAQGIFTSYETTTDDQPLNLNRFGGFGSTDSNL